MTKQNCRFYVYIMLNLFTMVSPNDASILQIINVSAHPIDVIIQPYEGGENPDYPEIHKIVHPNKTIVTQIEPKQLGKPETFSVIGKVNFYSLSERCTELDFKRNYIITLAHKIDGGVRCFATEATHNENSKE